MFESVHLFQTNFDRITFQESNVKIKHLKTAITTAPRGQSRLVPIKPDGKISLPFIGDIMAAGKTTEELHADLNEAYIEAGHWSRDDPYQQLSDWCWPLMLETV